MFDRAWVGFGKPRVGVDEIGIGSDQCSFGHFRDRFDRIWDCRPQGTGVGSAGTQAERLSLCISPESRPLKARSWTSRGTPCVPSAPLVEVRAKRGCRGPQNSAPHGAWCWRGGIDCPHPSLATLGHRLGASPHPTPSTARVIFSVPERMQPNIGLPSRIHLPTPQLTRFKGGCITGRHGPSMVEASQIGPRNRPKPVRLRPKPTHVDSKPEHWSTPPRVWPTPPRTRSRHPRLGTRPHPGCRSRSGSNSSAEKAFRQGPRASRKQPGRTEKQRYAPTAVRSRESQQQIETDAIGRDFAESDPEYIVARRSARTALTRATCEFALELLCEWFSGEACISAGQLQASSATLGQNCPECEQNWSRLAKSGPKLAQTQPSCASLGRHFSNPEALLRAAWRNSLEDVRPRRVGLSPTNAQRSVCVERFSSTLAASAQRPVRWKGTG